MTDIDAETQALQDWGEEGRATQRAIDDALATTRAELAAKDAREVGYVQAMDAMGEELAAKDAEIARLRGVIDADLRAFADKDATIHHLGENAAKAAERVAVLEAILVNVRDDLQMVVEAPLADPYILGELRALCGKHGYGNVMATTSALWRHLLQEQETGAFVAGPSVGAVRNRLKEIDAALTEPTDG